MREGGLSTFSFYHPRHDSGMHNTHKGRESDSYDSHKPSEILKVTDLPRDGLP